MRQLTYISSVTPSGRIALPEILQVSQRNNACSGLTGFLLCDGVRFLQTLEGEPGRLQATYDRIARDPRHRAIVMLRDVEVDVRQFGDWSMAGGQIGGESSDALVARVDAMTEAVTDRTLRAHYRSFVRIDRRAA